MIQLSCNVCQILPWVLRSKKVNLSGARGSQDGGKATWYQNSQHASIRLYCMSTSSLGHKEHKIHLHEIHTMFCSQDRGQNNKRSLTFWTGVKFSSSSDFNENRLKLIRLPCRFRKCIILYTLNVPNLVKGGQSSTATDHIWALTFDPLIHILPDFLDMQNYTFSESSWWSNQFEPIFVEIGPTWKFDPL